MLALVLEQGLSRSLFCQELTLQLLDQEKQAAREVGTPGLQLTIYQSIWKYFNVQTASSAVPVRRD